MEEDNNNMHESGADRTGADRFKDAGDEQALRGVREANENIRQGQGDDAAETHGRSGNRPRVDRDR